MTDEEITSKWGNPDGTRGAAAQHRSLAILRDRIGGIDEKPEGKTLEFLAEVARKTSMFNIFQVHERVEVYDLAQAKLISIPGHATYFRDKINALKEQARTGKLSLEDWDQQKSTFFQALGHMPSEEAVEVLGEYASDRFGFVYSKNPDDLAIPGLLEYKRSDYLVDFSVCMPAIKALEAVGIEDPPAKGQLNPDVAQQLWSNWWHEVKTGKRKYRFKGSSVEHPIHTPPGAPREVRRPDRHPETSPSKASKKPGPSTNLASAPGSKNFTWTLVLGGAVLSASLAFYWIKRRR